MSIEANTDQVRLLGGYVGELSLWGRRTNLTGNPSIEAIINGPLWDALTLIPVLREDGSLIDVGSGGGLPGIPAAILRPRMRVTLVEPRTKRGTFLRHAVHTLGLEADVIESRVENLEVPPFDGAVAQAVWPPEEWIKRAKLLVRPGGAIYVLSSSPLAGSDLTDEVRPEEEAHLVRPRDGARRSATRLTRA